MDFHVHGSDPVTLVEVPGTVIDANNSIDLKDSIEPLLHEKRVIVFNMGNIRFIDSTGCGLLIFCYRSISQRSGALKLANVSPAVMNTFRLISLDEIFDIYESVEDAMRHAQEFYSHEDGSGHSRAEAM